MIDEEWMINWLFPRYRYANVRRSFFLLSNLFNLIYYIYKGLTGATGLIEEGDCKFVIYVGKFYILCPYYLFIVVVIQGQNGHLNKFGDNHLSQSMSSNKKIIKWENVWKLTYFPGLVKLVWLLVLSHHCINTLIQCYGLR
jgi:hypothetical protein